jgi:hypothetical protein
VFGLNFATGDGDGVVNIWDGGNKKRLFQVCALSRSLLRPHRLCVRREALEWKSCPWGHGVFLLNLATGECDDVANMGWQQEAALSDASIQIFCMLQSLAQSRDTHKTA